MKPIALLSLVLGGVVALEASGVDGGAQGLSRRTGRPIKFSGRDVPHAMNKLADAPSGFTISTVEPTEFRSKAALNKVPVEFIEPSLRRRRESFKVLQKLRRQVLVSDFFECTNPSRRPATADCDVIINQLLSESQEFIVDANACLVFSFRTCQGFFCSLCQTLSTTSDFIGSQLDTVDALCVENGQAGTIVGEDPPQWDAGFTFAGAPLPTFDVC